MPRAGSVSAATCFQGLLQLYGLQYYLPPLCLYCTRHAVTPLHHPPLALHPMSPFLPRPLPRPLPLHAPADSGCNYAALRVPLAPCVTPTPSPPPPLSTHAHLSRPHPLRSRTPPCLPPCLCFLMNVHSCFHGCLCFLIVFPFPSAPTLRAFSATTRMCFPSDPSARQARHMLWPVNGSAVDLFVVC